MIALLDEALAEAADDDAGPRGSWPTELAPSSRRHRGRLADARAALEKAERVDDPALVAVAIARAAQPKGTPPRSLRACSSGEWRSRSGCDARSGTSKAHAYSSRGS